VKKLIKILIGIVAVLVLALGAVFFFTSGMVSVADDFFLAIKKQDIAAARSYLSEDFKLNTDEAALRDFLTKGALLNYKKTSWSNRQISGGRGELNGEVITQNGGVVPLKLMFVKENDAWKIYAIQKPTAGLQPQETSPAIPSKAQQIALFKRSAHDFAVSVNDKSMEHFRSTVSQLWQRQYTTEKLNETFGKLFDVGVDLTVLDGLDPVLDPVSALGDNGELVLTGTFPTQPNKVHFEQTYIYEGIDWKLLGLHINIK
jgi:hypothetical protein